MKAHEQYQLIFSHWNDSLMPENLGDKVMERIQAIKSRRARIRLVGYSTVCISALFALIPTSVWLINAAKYSGFSQYSSILFEDGLSTFTNWKALILSIAESLPVLETALVLGTILIFVNMLRSIVRTVSYIGPLTIGYKQYIINQ